MKKLFFTLLLVSIFSPLLARHVAGGELYYEYLGEGLTSGSSLYRITLRLFRDCASPGPFLQNERVNVGIYDHNGLLERELALPLQGQVEQLRLKTELFPCLVGNPLVCYEVAVYINTISLPNTPEGYILSRVGCCRIDHISNLATPLNVGSNYVTRIPGTKALPQGNNSSPQFRVRDTALVCAGKRFTLDFGATDKDDDSLTYSFCDGFTGPGGSNNNTPPRSLALEPLNYAMGYTGNAPLGPHVNIDPVTGIISGIAPPVGQYVVSVCIAEWRGGNIISEHRKDFILKVDDCDLIEASLPDKIMLCDDYTITFENNSTSSSINSYLWEFGVTGAANNTSTEARPTFTYADTGRFKVKLTVHGPGECIGYDSTEVFVYPGFKTDFTVTGICFQQPFQFNDATTSVFGTISSHRWNFGDIHSLADTSRLSSPSYKYGQGGFTAAVKLISTDDKGCVDSMTRDIVIRDKPLIPLPFKDTVICSIDSLQIPLNYTGNGSISWIPATHIINANTRNPTVFPKDTTHYIVTLNDGGCVNSDTVTVNVVDHITVTLGPDTTICLSDTITLRPQTIASTFSWTPVNNISGSTVRNLVTRPLQNTTYALTANLGSCQSTDQITVTVAPYPQVQINTRDTTICYGNRVVLHATTNAPSYSWAPANALLNANTLSPIAGPSTNTWFTLTALDPATGCPKASVDSVRVNVIPIISVNAGRDTIVVADQPLQLHATASGGTTYRWTPSLGVSDPTIFNPVIVLGEDIDSIRYRVRVSDAGGCFGEDEMLVRVFKGHSDLLVPNAFTPNGDGRNDVLLAIGPGIQDVQYFSIYNRWGQLLFQTRDLTRGWDGTYKGVKQPPGTYVYMAQGTDYRGKTIFRKGTVVLIR